MNRRKFIRDSGIGLILVRSIFNLQNLYGDNKKFDNSASSVGFIGHYSSVEELIVADTRELERIGGSFEEIADKIRVFLEYAKNEAYEKPNKSFIVPIVIIGYVSTRGMQFCPFEGCDENWNDIVFIQNFETRKKLTINRGIEHLARDHHLLEKGNEYEIIPEEFYKHFML